MKLSNRARAALVALIAVSAFGSAYAQTGNNYILGCQVRDSTSRLGLINYLQGFRMGAVLMEGLIVRENPKIKNKDLCIPKDVTAGQLTDVVCKYMADNPAGNHDDIYVIAGAAFMEAWPCTELRR